MKISKIKLDNFRRFTDLSVEDLSETTRLVVLAGPNGCGKSSLFDALFLKYRQDCGLGWSNDGGYYHKGEFKDGEPIAKGISIELHGSEERFTKGNLYIRSAYRNDPDFNATTLNRVGPVVDDLPLKRMIEADASVSRNYQRLASQAMEDVFARESASTTIGDFRNRIIGEVSEPLRRIFPDLKFVGLGNPLTEGTFKFEKGTVKNFDYKNLSGGEKAAFDLLLDIVVKKASYADAIYCIDEPEAHMNTRLQGALLNEMFSLIPQESQLWIATHSIGMMKKSRELYNSEPNKVTFLDFGNHNFDVATRITPSRPTRRFWEGILNVALDDLASLVAPKQIIICEGNPVSPVQGKNSEHDARVYASIFGDEFPDTKFISVGNSKEVIGDRLGFVSALPKVATGINVIRLIDRDDHAPQDIEEFSIQGVSVLSRRHLEAYLYDDEVLKKLCENVGKSSEVDKLIFAKNEAMAASVERGNPPDDLKSAAPVIYVKAKKILEITKVGDDQMAFARNTLAPLIKPGMVVYEDLKRDIFKNN
ncbi:AAA family ATPase [Burkholderia gladioli]|uniref:AAA family ATPase n=1 Tax=Burkholderia gladioli TaxID=28095 RepID=UPI0016415F8A|nr:AAA family ATPase [Burkholderia gladioli]